MTTAATLFAAESSQSFSADDNSLENAENMLQDLLNRLEDVVPLVFFVDLWSLRSNSLFRYQHGFEFLDSVYVVK